MAFQDHGLLPSDTRQAVRQKTLSSDYRRRICAPLLEIWDLLRQQWDDLWLHRLDPWSPASHLPHTCHLCRACDTVYSTVPVGTNRCAQCSQVAACRWGKPSRAPHRRTEYEAVQRRIEGAQTPSHSHAGPASVAHLWFQVQLMDPTSVAHLSHVFAP